MNEPTHFDLLSIGGGFAGLCTAVRSAELGLRTAVLEAGTDESYICSSRWAGRIFHVSYHDVTLSPDELLAAINRRTSGETDQELAATIAADAGSTADWLASRGSFHSGPPDRLAPLHAGAPAPAGDRAGLAGAWPGPAARRIAAAVPGATGPACSWHQSGIAAPGARPSHRRDRT